MLINALTSVERQNMTILPWNTEPNFPYDDGTGTASTNSDILWGKSALKSRKFLRIHTCIEYDKVLDAKCDNIPVYVNQSYLHTSEKVPYDIRDDTKLLLEGAASVAGAHGERLTGALQKTRQPHSMKFHEYIIKHENRAVGNISVSYFTG